MCIINTNKLFKKRILLAQKLHFISSKGGFQALIHIYLIVTLFKVVDKIIGELKVKMKN